MHCCDNVVSRSYEKQWRKVWLCQLQKEGMIISHYFWGDDSSEDHSQDEDIMNKDTANTYVQVEKQIQQK